MKKIKWLTVLVFWSNMTLSGLAADIETLLAKAAAAPDSAAFYFALAENQLHTATDSLSFLFAKTRFYYNARSLDSTLHYGNQFLAHQEGAQAYRSIFVYRYISKRMIDQGRYEEALQYAHDALHSAEYHNDLNEVAYQYCDIAIIYHDFEDYANGVAYAKKALEVLQDYPDAKPLFKTYALNDIAINFDDWGMPDSALHYHFQVFELKDQIDTFNIGFTYNNIANTLIKMDRLKEALPFLQTAIKISQSRNDDYRLTTNYTNLATISYKLGDHPRAQLYFDSADHYAARTKSVEKWLDLYQEKYLFYRITKNFDAAMGFQEEYYQLRDSIFKVERARTLAEMETKYQTALKDQQLADQQLALLTQQATLQKTLLVSLILALLLLSSIVIYYLSKSRHQKKQELLYREKELAVQEAHMSAALASQEKERRRFAQDLHDGFGQLISSLKIYIGQIQKSAAREEKAEAYDKSEQVLEEMHREIRNIAFNLMPATLIQYGLVAAVKELAQRINQTGEVAVRVDAYELERRLSEVEEIMLYRIAQEWLNNIIKYAHATKINVQMIRHEDEVLLQIEDNGDGFDPNRLKESEGNGWKNIQSRIKLVGGQVYIDSSLSRRGSTFEVSIPQQVEGKKNPEAVSVK